MPYFVVTLECGPAWDAARSMREQERWDEHAAYMDGLVEEGFIVLGGPLGDGPKRMLVVKAESEEAIERRLAPDPWRSMQLLRTVSVQRWKILLGEPSA
ncbi:MAG: YciI family protein [Vulcanimicrobiaceae bacterium]